MVSPASAEGPLELAPAGGHDAPRCRALPAPGTRPTIGGVLEQRAAALDRRRALGFRDHYLVYARTPTGSTRKLVIGTSDRRVGSGFGTG